MPASRYCFALALPVVFCFCPIARADDAAIRLNTLGYLPDAPKRASVALPCTTFRVVRDADRIEVFAGHAPVPAINADTGESLATVDFSAIHTPGVYRLDVPGVGRSPPFRIAGDVYDFAFYTAARGFYLWRCGTAVSGNHNGVSFEHAACHPADAFGDLVGLGHQRKATTGGWHDAGDYNKYTVNGAFSVGVMLQACDNFGDRLAGMRLDIPESANDTPDFLDELRWELEWLRTMQAADGSAYHKVSTKKFGGFVLPEAETAERYLAPWSSTATADLVAVMAMASRQFRKYDANFASACGDSACRGYAFLVAHPENHNADLSAFSTGPYQANDAPHRLWAAAELWEATGEAQYLKDFEARARALNRPVDLTAGWGNPKNLAMYTYVMSEREGRDRALLETVRSAIVAAAGEIVKTRDGHGYARPLGARYYWGCNGDVAQQVQTLHVAHFVKPNRAYVETSLDALNHLFGRNCYGRSFVTGLGSNPPLHPHDRRSGADNVEAPWPGYLIGGGWPKATDWHDNQADYRTNEIAINWNATLVYALAGFVERKPAGEKDGTQ